MTEKRKEPNEKNYEVSRIPPETGFRIQFVTMKHNSNPHWHRSMEVLYILNGSATVMTGGQRYKVRPLELIVTDSATVHEVVYELPQTMGILIHLSKEYYRRYIPQMRLLHFRCRPGQMSAEQNESYLRLCGYLKDLTILYFEDRISTPLKNASLILSIAAELVENFSEPIPDEGKLGRDPSQLARVQQVFEYVSAHYAEPLTLQEVADEMGLNREYFCRFFKKNTGMSFLQYLSQVRLNHVYQDLLYSEGSIQEILDNNGITNQKLFYRQFKETFQCSPRELKRLSKDNPYIT